MRNPSLPTTLGKASHVSVLYPIDANDEAFMAELTALEEAQQPSTSSVTYEDQTDTDNATRFVETHGAVLHYIAKWKRWICFSDDQQRWIEDHADVMVLQRAKDVGRSLKKQLVNVPSRDLSNAARFVTKSLGKPGITAMVDLARGESGIPLDHEELDANDWLLGVLNGVLDLKTGKLRLADPRDLMTKQCPVAFDPDAECPRFLQAMEEWQDDEEVRKYIQRLAGYALFGKQEEHIFAIHFGTGANGKSSFVKALQNVLGPYAMVPSLSVLVNTGRKEHDTVRAAFFRKRLAVASETEQRVSLDEASIKNLTGNDRMSVRGMHQNPWEFDPTHTLWLCTNFLPEITGRDTGIWRRIKVVPWLQTFTGKDSDKKLDEKLRAEAPGILRWLVQGCLDWQKHGLEEPEAVKRASLDYRDAEDVFTAFVKECGLVFDPQLEKKIAAKELTGLLYDWCKEEGRKQPKGMSDWLEENGCKKIQIREKVEGEEKKPRYWKGVGLSSNDPEEETDETV